jgi:hypothetical protein
MTCPGQQLLDVDPLTTLVQIGPRVVVGLRQCHGQFYAEFGLYGFRGSSALLKPILIWSSDFLNCRNRDA